jgi:hypothetical protein
MLGLAFRLAKGVGVDPWTLLPRLPEMWSRIWIGGGVSIIKLGPKEARIEIAGWACARTAYCRVAMRGILSALVELFCQKSYAKELSALCTPMTLGYRLSWV